MNDEQSVIKTILIFIILNLFSFILKFLWVIIVFAMFIAPIICIFSIIHDFLAIPQTSAIFIAKFLLTVAPAVPTYFYAAQYLKDDSESPEHLSMDLCFALWIFIAIGVWIFL